jgi:hypothetical protein
MIMDHFRDKWEPLIPTTPSPLPFAPHTIPSSPFQPQPHPLPEPKINPIPAPTEPRITPEEIAEFRRLLDRAREYDRKNNEPDCELEEKKAAIKTIAKALGVDIDFL